MSLDTTEALLLLYADAATNRQDGGVTASAVVDALESADDATDGSDEDGEAVSIDHPTVEALTEQFDALSADGLVRAAGDGWELTDEGESQISRIRSEFADDERFAGPSAIPWFEALVDELSARDSDHPALVDVFRSLGTAYSDVGIDDAAVDRLNRAYELAADLDDDAGGVGAKIDLGRAYEAAGQFDDAASQYRKANYAATEAGLDRAAASALADLGTVYYQAGDDIDQARSTLEDALDAYESVAAPLGECSVRRLLTTVCYDAGDFDAAVNHGEAALSLADEIEDESNASFERGLVQIALGRVHTDREDFSQAIDSFDAGIELIDNSTPQAMRARLWLADALLETGQVDDATAQVDTAEEIVAEGTVPNEFESLVTLRRGRLEHAKGDTAEAKQLYKEAADTAQGVAAFRTMVLSYYYAGLADLAEGNTFYANERLGRARHGGNEFGEWDVARKADTELDQIED